MADLAGPAATWDTCLINLRQIGHLVLAVSLRLQWFLFSKTF